MDSPKFPGIADELQMIKRYYYRTKKGTFTLYGGPPIEDIENVLFTGYLRKLYPGRFIVYGKHVWKWVDWNVASANIYEYIEDRNVALDVLALLV